MMDIYARKAEVQAQIQEIYHSHNGVDGYRSMKVYLERKGYSYSAVTVHKYMNTELDLRSIVRRKVTGDIAVRYAGNHTPVMQIYNGTVIAYFMIRKNRYM